MKTKIAVLSTPPEIEVEDKFFNKACCYLARLGNLCDFIPPSRKGSFCYDSYECEISFVSSPKKISVKVDSISCKLHLL